MHLKECYFTLKVKFALKEYKVFESGLNFMVAIIVNNAANCRNAFCVWVNCQKLITEKR